VKRPKFIARQSGNPRGMVGRFIAWIMAKETSAVNDAVLARLRLQADDQLLEVGFGHGHTVRRAADRVAFVGGVDVSPTMLSVATRANRTAIADGKVELKLGDGITLDFEDARFDKLLSVHTIYFWTNPAATLAEFHRVLRPGGRVVLAFNPAGAPRTQKFPDDIYTFYSDDQVRALLSEAGLETEDVVAIPDAVPHLAIAHRR